MLYNKPEHYKNMKEKVQGNFTKFAEIVLKSMRRCPDLEGGCNVDFHWQPMYRRCDYCHVHYDLIGKLEDFEQDSQIIFEARNVTAIIESYDKDDESVKVNETPKRQGKYQEYFNMLSEELVQEFIRIYYFDLKLFGYDMTKYISSTSYLMVQS